jgi:hypothetical protein
MWADHGGKTIDRGAIESGFEGITAVPDRAAYRRSTRVPVSGQHIEEAGGRSDKFPKCAPTRLSIGSVCTHDPRPASTGAIHCKLAVVQLNEQFQMGIHLGWARCEGLTFVIWLTIPSFALVRADWLLSTELTIPSLADVPCC